MSRIRSIAARITRATLAAARDLTRLALNDHGAITVAAYLRKHGATDQWINRWGSAFGRRVAANHRKTTGTEPTTKWEYSRGVLREHMAYQDSGLLYEALVHYRHHKTASADTGLPRHDRRTAATLRARDERGRFLPTA